MPNDVIGSLGGGSLGLRGAPAFFDVQKASDVIALLKLIHQNPIDGDIKNHLRDLIFAHQQESSPAALEALVDACAQLGISIVSANTNIVSPSKKTIKEEHAQLKLGHIRPLPTFSQNQKSPLSGIQVTPNQEQGRAEKESREQQKQENLPKVASSASIAQSPVVNSPILQPVSAKPAFVSKEPLEQVRTQSLQSSPETIQQRISEIKKIVNEKVGNPVNLIDSHNEIGRAYMNALLDAMKKVNGGKPEDVAAAMEILEDAFTKVIGILGGDTPVQAQQEQSVNEVPPRAIEQTQRSATPEQKKEVTVTQTPPFQAAQASIVKIKTGESVTPTQKTALPNAREAEVRKIDIVSPTAPISEKQTVQTPPAPSAEIPIRMQVTNVPEVEVKKEVPAVNAAEGLRSVAKDKQLQELLRANREKEVATKEAKEKEDIAQMNPLFTPEVTAGLGQLLSEWGLFKSSGFFGTGPSGKEHALYLKLANLTMATVIAGRFEGATPLIKQSITDYMNGWRYEEGIIHEHGETFEQYLRKVVHHILEKKKKSITRV